MAKGRVIFYEDTAGREAASPVRHTAGGARRRVRRRKRRRRSHALQWLLFVLAAAVLAGAVGVVLCFGSEPPAAIASAEADAGVQSTDDSGTETAAATVQEDTRIVVAVDPGHGGVNTNIGTEDMGSEANGLYESEITHQTAQLLYEKLAADDRFAPIMTADGSEYLKPSERGAIALEAGAELLVSIHLNYDGSASTSGFECYAAPPALSTNAESVRFGELLAAAFGDMGLRIRGETGVRYIYYDENDNKQVYEASDMTVRDDPTFTVLSSCGCPAVLCEEGFISSPSDMAILSGDSGCEAAAEAYYQCICEYFGLA